MGDVNTGGGASVGGDANSGRDIVGRDLIENNYYESPPPKLPPDHQYRKYTLADAFAILIGNDLTGDPGLVRRMIAIEQEIATLRQEIKENQEKPVTLTQVVSAVVAVVLLIIIVLLLGIWLGGMR